MTADILTHTELLAAMAVHRLRGEGYALMTARAPMPPLAVPERRVLSADEAAQYLGYEKATAAFRSRCVSLGIRALWHGAYDRVLINNALDRASGLIADDAYGAMDYGENRVA